MIYTPSSRGNQHPSTERTRDRLLTNLCHSLAHKLYSRTPRNTSAWYHSWDLFVVSSPLRAAATGTTFSLLLARNHIHTLPFFRVRTVRKEYGRCSPQLTKWKSWNATGTISRAVSRDSYTAIRTRATMSNAERTAAASDSTSEQTPQT